MENVENQYRIKGGMTLVIIAFFLCFIPCITRADSRDLDLWVCPVGGYEDPAAVEELAQDYHRIHPDVEITVRVLDAENGMDEVEDALGTLDAPDLIIASPEYLVTKWGNDGSMADLSDLWSSEASSEIDGEIRLTCQGLDGGWYQIPLFRDVYTMAVNYNLFWRRGLVQYLDENAHSWKDSGFIDSVLVLHDYMLSHEDKDIVVAKIPCRDKKDQRQFMSFITNLSDGSLVNSTMTGYTLSSSAVRTSFSILRNLQGKGIEYDPGMGSDDEIRAFLDGELPVTFFWSYYRQQQYASSADFTVFPMMYPNSKNLPVLTGDICGIGAVKQEDAQALEDSIDFIRFLSEDPDEYTKAVSLSGCLPVRSRVQGTYLKDVYESDESTQLYRFFLGYATEYSPSMPLFTDLEEKWPELVRQIAEGGKIKALTQELDALLNTRLSEEFGITQIEEEDAEEG